MGLVTTSEKAQEWGMSSRRVQKLAANDRIPGAKKIGGVWLIPSVSTKPTAEKLSEKGYYKKTIKNRKQLKTLLNKICAAKISPEISTKEIRIRIISTLNSSILVSLFDNEESEEAYIIARNIYNFLGGKGMFYKEDFDILFSPISKYIDNTNGDSLNTLSWAYQYLNQVLKKDNNQYSSTQFFTEQYMIDYLLSNVPEKYEKGVIFDPCCGGGHMLTATIQKLFYAQKEQNFNALQSIVDKIMGYDIDPLLARVAVLNIKTKCVELLKSTEENVSFETWSIIQPKIYYSNESIEGSLDRNLEVINCITKEKKRLSSIDASVEIVITNPPFATVKGMNKSLNLFLKNNYPDGNSDLCASFILRCGTFLRKKGIALMVVQNSWMFLDSFSLFRKNVLNNYSFGEILDLGSGAFLDLTGEKSNVALIKFKIANQHNQIQYKSLKNKTIKDKINGTFSNKVETHYLNQEDILNNENSRFDVLNLGTIKKFYYSGEHVSNYATPMQGTSTGNSKELVGYFWEHFGEKEWKLVSKGGGYSRWQGLNRYVVKWGENGEFIQSQKGSAIRNSKYFGVTQLVYSDTGTSGLNVRVLLDGELFIASGPGIRVANGNFFSILSLLNSKLSSYYLRILSPKLTIAAGYIAKLPINSEIANSPFLETQAQICINTKKLLLMNRPNNFEFSFEVMESLTGNFESRISNLIINEIRLEMQKIEAEYNIEKYIIEKSGISESDLDYIWNEVGEPVNHIGFDETPQIAAIDKLWFSSTDATTYLSKNKTEKHHIGSDGIIEYMSYKLQVNPSALVQKVEQNVVQLQKVRKKYKNLLLHNGLLKYLEYDTKNGVKKKSATIRDSASYLEQYFEIESGIEEWIQNYFEEIHNEIFMGIPFLKVVQNDDGGEIQFYG